MNTKTKWLIGAGAVAVGALVLSSCKKEYAPLATVPAVDLQKYAGTWYEISALPQRFEKGCHCTKAHYTTTSEGYVKVHNSCRKGSPTGEVKAVTGKAFPVDGSNNSKLKVQFFWPFKGDYWILDLADDYSYALVGSPDRESLWVLARTPRLDDET
ncbi:MAG: lipocalin family protein [Hymenobacteraceae bacterium]|nr:lipocalin family protein [Hymenobacteraceae bacterium]MDX5396148.1 lipocalin family protein [Hymenobacteraceae bacterium]MDX5443848.1 lipocalin family protein [Hymenobacteraceae bacterium]MDX5512209.1 lipocalin family protein [Hymenobacteraceae bacterium]